MTRSKFRTKRCVKATAKRLREAYVTRQLFVIAEKAEKWFSPQLGYSLIGMAVKAFHPDKNPSAEILTSYRALGKELGADWRTVQKNMRVMQEAGVMEISVEGKRLRVRFTALTSFANGSNADAGLDSVRHAGRSVRKGKKAASACSGKAADATSDVVSTAADATSDVVSDAANATADVAFNTTSDVALSKHDKGEAVCANNCGTSGYNSAEAGRAREIARGNSACIVEEKEQKNKEISPIPPYKKKENEKEEDDVCKKRKMYFTQHTHKGDASRFEKSVEERKAAFSDTIRPYVDSYGREFCNEFFNYWTELSQDGTMMRFEAEHFWSIRMRLDKWQKTEFKNHRQGGAKPAAAVRVADSKAEAQRAAEREANEQRRDLETYMSVPRDIILLQNRLGHDGYKNNADQAESIVRRCLMDDMLNRKEKESVDAWLGKREKMRSAHPGFAVAPQGDWHMQNPYGEMQQ